MAHKHCPNCGRFMKLTDLLPLDEDEFDDELAFECGLTDDEYNEAIFDTKGKWARFHYIQDQWECEDCQITEWHHEGKKYNYNPGSNAYDGAKPLTPTEQVALEAKQQEEAGQLRLL